jgi:hypothetical protein
MCPHLDGRPRLARSILASIFIAAPAARAGDASAPAPAVPATYSTVVRAPGPPPQPVSADIGGDSARGLPGTGGDPALAAQDLPGVARPAPGATGLVVWGSAPAETRVLFDGVEIPALYHFGGFRSTVGAALVERIEVVPGAYSAEYGRALGGLVRIDSRRLEAGDEHLALDANLLDASASWRARLLQRLRLGIAARASYLGQTYGRVAPADATALFPIPRYLDGQAEAALDLTARARLRAWLLTSFDRVSRRLDGAAPGLPDRVEDQRLGWWRAALTYEELGEDDRLAATLFAGGDRAALDQRFGSTPAAQELTRADFGLRARYQARLAAGSRLTVGLDARVERARIHRSGSLSVPAREGDLTVFGQPPGDDVNADRWTATQGDIAPFVIAAWTRGRWTFSPELRADAFPVDGSRALPPVGATPLVGYGRLDGALDPRGSVTCSAGQDLLFTAAAGAYHQPADAADLSAVFGSPALGPARALHVALSIQAWLASIGSVEVTGFYRRLDGLAVRSPLPAPVLAEALVPDGHGRSFGLQAVVRRELAGGTLAWLTYTGSRAQRWSGDGPARLLDFDQTHVVTAIARHRTGAWTVGARARYATGMPRTPVVGSFVDARDGIDQPIFGAQNSARLPGFFQLDGRVDRALTTGAVAVTLYLDVQNLTARRNAEERVYSRDFTSSGYLTGPPLLALLGLRIES